MASTGERLILASSSPTRRRLLADAGLEFEIEPARIDEAAVRSRFAAGGRSASDCALALAEAKGRYVAARHPSALVIGADQMLVCDGVWIDKPPDLADARLQLQNLRGRTHQLLTAACVVEGPVCKWRASCSAQLTMREFSNAFLDRYMAAEGAAILASVGAYRLEGRGIQLFARIEGDYFAILGIPLLELLSFLREHGALPR
jgi:septum formation protein